MSAQVPPANSSLQLIQRYWLQLRHISTFEKAIVANSCIILLDSAAGWWVTQHNPEPYHYLIDTAFIVLASVLGLAVNFMLLRAAFAPFHSVLATIRTVARGDVDARVTVRESGADTADLADAFNTMLDRLEDMRREASARVLRAQEEERRRLALELHDQTGQSLTALSLHAAAIAHRLEDEESEAAKQAHRQAEQLGRLAQRTLAEVQELSRQLRPPLLDDLGLEAALTWLAEDASERLQALVTVHISTEPITKSEGASRLPADIETALFRIAQESVTNAVRHGHAEHISIAFSRTSTELVLQVTDDGSGFETANEPKTTLDKRGRGIGIEGMRERAHLIGGSFALHSKAGHGGTVRVGIPVTSVESLAADSANKQDIQEAASPVAFSPSPGTEHLRDRMRG